MRDIRQEPLWNFRHGNIVLLADENLIRVVSFTHMDMFGLEPLDTAKIVAVQL